MYIPVILPMKKCRDKKKVYKDGSVYEGSWLFGLYSGKGVLSWPNKNRYEGNFSTGVALGNGAFYRNGVLLFEGNFNGTSTYSTATTWLLTDGRFARRTTYTDGSIFEIWHPDQSMFIGSIIDIGYNGSISEIKPREGSLLYATGKGD